MNLSEYILEFLLQDNAVTIQPFGTFRLECILAKFDMQTNSFTPSVKRIVLTSEDIGNEEFISFLIKKEDISEELALTFWNNYVSLIRERFKTENQCHLANLGSLTKIPQGGYLFAQDETVDLQGDSFGFFTLKDVKTYKPEEFLKQEEDTVEEIIPEEKIEEQALEAAAPKAVSENISNENEWQKVVDLPQPDEAISELREEENLTEELKNEDYIDEITDEKPLDFEENTPTHTAENVVEEIADQLNPEQEVEEIGEEITGEKKEPVSVSENTDIIGVQAEYETGDDNNECNQTFFDSDETIAVPPPPIPEKRRKKKKKAWIFVIIILLLLLIFAAYLLCCNTGSLTFCNPFATKNTEIRQEEMPDGNAIPLPIAHRDTVVMLEDMVVTAESSPQPDIIRTTDGISFLGKSQKGIDIITGFFKVETNALKQAQSMKKMGYDAYIIERKPAAEKQYFVSIGSFNNKEEAINFMREVSKSKKIDLVLKKWW